MTRALRFTGWTLILAGTIVLLYVVYSLLFTGVATEQAQDDLRESWQANVVPAAAPAADPSESPTVAPSGGATETPAAAVTVPEGAAIAVLEFSRPDAPPPVHAEPLYVVEGVSAADLARGPGHYPGTALPGEPGNVAIAGHRTTYAAPFYHLDQLRPGDEIHLTGRDGVRHTYRFVEQRIVSPSAGEVLLPDPLGTGTPLLTLTTCHPRFSAAQRLVVFAELVTA